jgi:hypothetical protein
MNRHRMFLTLAALCGSGAGLAAQFTPIRPVPVPPSVLINEVCFDQTGVDTAALLGSEYVELYVKDALNLGSYKLSDHTGANPITLPSVSIPANTIVLIIYGGGANAYDPDPVVNDGDAAFMLGLPPGNHLGNASGGVRLLDASLNIVDCVYWGTGSAPSGASGANWTAGTYFNLAFAGSPMNEGDSLGRSANPVGNYTGKVADWQRNGGKNAGGPTPRARNRVDSFTTTNSQIKWVQTGINQIVTNFGSNVDPSWFSFVGSSVSNIVVTTQANGFTVVADHAFDLLDHSSPTTLAGQMTATYTWSDTPGAVTYTRTTQGTVSSPNGYSFAIDHSETVSGYHTNTITGVTTTDTVFTWAGTPYAFGVDTTESLQRTGLGTWVSSDVRVCQDYGGAGPKNSTRSMTVRRLSDGVYGSTCSIDRDYPIGPPYPGTSDSIQYLESKRIDTLSTTTNDFGEFDTQITRYDVYLDNVLVTGLQAGANGTSSQHYQPASVAEPLGSGSYALSLPVEQFGSANTLGGTVYVAAALVGIDPLADLVYSADVAMTINGFPVDSFQWSIDPPQQTGPAPQKPEEGFLDAVGDCAAKGAGVGAGAGLVVGGVAGAIGGAAVGTAVGTLGGPPGMVAAATGGGVGGAAAGGFVGTVAGAGLGAGVGAVCCGIGNLWDKIF